MAGRARKDKAAHVPTSDLEGRLVDRIFRYHTDTTRAIESVAKDMRSLQNAVVDALQPARGASNEFGPRVLDEAPTPTKGDGRKTLPVLDLDRDPWKHRSATMRCRTCMWFAPKETYADQEIDGIPGDVGRCRRHAPTMSGYPVVFQKDWCGDHKLDESRL